MPNGQGGKSTYRKFSVMESRHSANGMQDFLAGAVGGIAGMVVGHPFDTTKVQLQTQEGRSRFRGTMDAMKSIKHHGLIRGFFRGMSFPLLTNGGVNAVIFGVYGGSLRVLAQDRPPGLQDVYLAGCLAGTSQLLIACPADVIKCTLQAQIPRDGLQQLKGTAVFYRGPRECVRKMWQQTGWRGLYRGLNAMALRDIPSYGLYLVCYESISSTMRAKGWTDSQGVIADVIGGGLAGTIAWFVVMPCDVIKSRVQSDVIGKYRGFVHCARQAVRLEGASVLYRGTLVTCLRGFPVNATTFLVYAQTLKYLNGDK